MRIGARNEELEELRRRIEELENIRNGEDELASKVEEEIEIKQNDEDKDPTVRLIPYMSNMGSTRVEVSCYEGSLIAKSLIDWIG